MEKEIKNNKRQITICKFLIVYQFLVILNYLINGSILSTFNNIGFFIGTYIVGMVAIPSLIIALKKEKKLQQVHQ